MVENRDPKADLEAFISTFKADVYADNLTSIDGLDVEDLRRKLSERGNGYIGILKALQRKNPPQV